MRSLLLLIPVAMLAACEQAPEVSCRGRLRGCRGRDAQHSGDRRRRGRRRARVDRRSEVESVGRSADRPCRDRRRRRSRQLARRDRQAHAAQSAVRDRGRARRGAGPAQDRPNADGASGLAVQIADVDAGRLRADAARVRQCRVASRQHQRGRRECAHHARGHRRASADHGHDHREDGRARHRDHVADATPSAAARCS